MRGARIAILCVLMTACGGGQDTAALSDDTTTTTTTDSTTTTTAPTTTSAPTTTTSVPTTTTTSATTTTISAEQLAKAEGVGDIASGEQLFFTELSIPGTDYACSTCHTLDGVEGRSPTLLSTSVVAGERVEGLSDIEYLRQSIVDPAAHEEDWPAVMPRTYADVLLEEQVNDLVAFLLTQ
jgi:mono/diheme cytochrome c family protein